MNCYDGIGDLLNYCNGVNDPMNFSDCEPRNRRFVGELMNCCDGVGDPVNRCDCQSVNRCVVATR